MDRLAALADILPPLPPAPLPPAPWWQTPLPWLALVFALALCVWVLLGWRRGRVWRLLRAQARAVLQRETQGPQTSQLTTELTTQLATHLAAQLRLALPEAGWPQPLRTAFDALRFAPASAETSITLKAAAQTLESAATQALRAAWWGRARAYAAFVHSLQHAALKAVQ
ncbi:conserved hypothetical protein [Thiomonas arsenitoxydans]|uniref:DUF4381 domain-containing protein n=1 Tax=Thiomonas arsenitoxydans (strain DSM 22701 / CIP 110005 / 3As) TaxID=426114 RepID=D6CSG3_THIA3|nr:hypothetical protein [Thiomonas arsenitoxydans]CAZ87691.1 conserved hypothetical protein [Thiomonas arsenitoxydans]CQR26814.1 conserved hypothetical protein [Thiomonas arsenitoxydans]CQR30495.1 conserved hypothetical protein [Thiomonas arsenitoxydans]CQR30524.1 conserved hypothetical protein [Thiomonas arsenitoxydans]CQR32097.1 conserved hypothetical protein [Thiomonas arsenitoxydans]